MEIERFCQRVLRYGNTYRYVQTREIIKVKQRKLQYEKVTVDVNLPLENFFHQLERVF